MLPMRFTAHAPSDGRKGQGNLTSPPLRLVQNIITWNTHWYITALLGNIDDLSRCPWIWGVNNFLLSCPQSNITMLWLRKYTGQKYKRCQDIQCSRILWDHHSSAENAKKTIKGVTLYLEVIQELHNTMGVQYTDQRRPALRRCMVQRYDGVGPPISRKKHCVPFVQDREVILALHCLRHRSVVVSTSAWHTVIRGTILGPCMLF